MLSLSLTYSQAINKKDHVRALFRELGFAGRAEIHVEPPAFDEDQYGDRLPESFPWADAWPNGRAGDEFEFKACIKDADGPFTTTYVIRIPRWTEPARASAIRQCLSRPVRKEFDKALMEAARKLRSEAIDLTEKSGALFNAASNLISVVAEPVVADNQAIQAIFTGLTSPTAYPPPDRAPLPPEGVP
jgi:hypothetical protein